MNRTEKAAAVATLEADLAKASNAVLFGFAGLKATEVTELRRQVRGTQSKYVVVKNTLALRATKGTALEGVAKHFTGPTAVAYNQSSPVALAKVLTAFARTNPNLVFKAAVVEGFAVEAGEIAAIAALPSREDLVSKLLFLIQSPMRRLVTVLNGPAVSLAGTLQQIADQKARSGGADAAPANG
jgi:large subunit ribosomal protein L10